MNAFLTDLLSLLGLKVWLAKPLSALYVLSHCTFCRSCWELQSLVINRHSIPNHCHCSAITEWATHFRVGKIAQLSCQRHWCFVSENVTSVQSFQTEPTSCCCRIRIVEFYKRNLSNKTNKNGTVFLQNVLPLPVKTYIVCKSKWTLTVTLKFLNPMLQGVEELGSNGSQ